MTLEAVRFEGHDGVRVEGDGTAVIVTTSVGPRVLALETPEGNPFAVLPDAGITRPDGSRYRFLGGHRLWTAPEIPEITYEADERPSRVEAVGDGVAVEAPADGAGLIKRLEIRPSAGGWIVDHRLTNGSGSTMTVAPWAITQLRLGGEVIIPIGPSADGPTADRSLVLWPYTDLGDPRLRFGRDEVRIDAVPGPAPLKLGIAPGSGRVAYRMDGGLFGKHVEVDPDPGAAAPDRGAAIQAYLCDEFCELETVGPLRAIEPGASVGHRERWTFEPHLPPPGGDG